MSLLYSSSRLMMPLGKHLHDARASCGLVLHRRSHVPTSGERHVAQRHEFAKQIIERSKYFKGLPGKLRQPKLMEQPLQFTGQLRYRGVLRKHQSCLMTILKYFEFQSVEMSRQVFDK